MAPTGAQPSQADQADSAGTARASAGGPAQQAGYHTLLDTARQLGGSLEPAAIFERLQRSVCGAMRCDGLIVSTYDRATNQIHCSYAWVGGNVLDPAGFPPLPFRPDGEGMQSQVIRTGRPAIYSDVADRVRDPRGTFYEVTPQGAVRPLGDGAPPPSSRSALMVPLRFEGEVVGVVQVMAEADGVYAAADLELLEGISLLLAVALENARLYRRAQDELEERRRAEAELRETEEALREANQRKDEFLATLGHELRNPLNSILNAVELLRRADHADEDDRWGHDLIQRQVVHLTRLIDDLLDVSRITHGRLELRRGAVELNELLEASVEAFRPLVEPGGRAVSWTGAADPVYTDADAVRLAQVLSNLLDNAAKYTLPGGHIEARLEREGDEAVVTVQDDGAGIPPEHLPHVFDLFYQAERPLGRVRGGLGIGLTLVKRLIEMHGGSVEAFSRGAGTGSQFVVRLPIRTAAPAAHPEAPRAPVPIPIRPRRILIADDNQDSAESMAMLLRLSGHEVEVASDGEDALRRAAGFHPEVLVLDIGMPRLSGYEVAQRIRAETWGRDMVLIAATGWGQEEDRRRALATGFDFHLVKPVEHERLLALLESPEALRRAGR